MVATGLLILWSVPRENEDKPEVDERLEPAIPELDETAGEESRDPPDEELVEPAREEVDDHVDKELLNLQEDLDSEGSGAEIAALECTEPEPESQPPDGPEDLQQQFEEPLLGPEVADAAPEDSPAGPEAAEEEPDQPISQETSEAELQPAEPKTPPSNPRAKEAYLKLWQRTPEFDNQFVALFANWQSGPSPFERRRGVERLKAEQKAICVSSEKRWDTLIKNLSVGGAELLHPEPVPRNTRLALVPEDYEDTVTGRVSWVRENGAGFRIGLNFDLDPETLSESWVAETLLGLGSEFLIRRAPRRYVRVATEVHSRLVTEDGRHIEVVLCDVSLGGCLLQSEEPFQVEELTLRLGSVDCLGKVVNNRKRPDEGWSHHVTFAPMGPLETLRLLRTISSLLKKR